MPPSGMVPEDSEDDKQDLVIPADVLNMDPKSLEMYKQALRDGKEKVYNIRVMVVGQYGVGKTTLTKRLLGRDVKIFERKSTEGIDIHKDCCKVTLGTGEWITQEKSGGEGCQAVFYNEITSNCQGHSSALTDLDDCFDEEGSKYYHKCTSKRPRNCQEIMRAGQHITGIYTIYPDDDWNCVNVWCDMDTDGGGWTVFQRRVDGSVDFNRSWTDYKSGFGNANTENWLGLDNIHKLTSQRNVTLRVDLITPGPPERPAYAVYSKFTVGDEASKYILAVTGYSGNAGDAMSYHNGMKFTTKDSDNDLTSTNCARDYCGGNWYKSCHLVNLNGVYGSTIPGMGIKWSTLSNMSMTYTEAKLR